MQNGKEVDAAGVHRHLIRSFCSEGGYGEAYAAMKELANTVPRADAGGAYGYQLYTQFRPSVPPGKAGWGHAGCLDLKVIRRITKEAAALGTSSVAHH